MPGEARGQRSWRCRERIFDLSLHPLVMGVVNITPDSFSDGGRFLDPGAAVAHGRRLLAEGADLLDLGAESTRPGAAPVPPGEQLRRLTPVITALAADGACLSVDTAGADVAERVLALGAHAINDVTALGDSAMAATVARQGAGLVLMHMQGTPATMQQDPHYDDAVREIACWLGERAAAARAAGVAPECIALDPGIGFGKTVRHNLELIARLDELAALGHPLVVGASRKSFLGKLLDLPVEERLEGSLVAAAVAAFEGASILRVHDVAATVRASRVAAALRAARRR